MDIEITAEKKRRRLARKAGFSLLEILIVISIIALIATLVGPRVFKLFSGAQTKTAATQMKTIKEAVNIMHLDIGRYPTANEGLGLLVQAPGEGVPNWNGPYMDAVPTDPWGEAYRLLPPEGDNAPKIASFGKDKQEGGSGDDADIII